jgi:hypothetical protein
MRRQQKNFGLFQYFLFTDNINVKPKLKSLCFIYLIRMMKSCPVTQFYVIYHPNLRYKVGSEYLKLRCLLICLHDGTVRGVVGVNQGEVSVQRSHHLLGGTARQVT